MTRNQVVRKGTWVRIPPAPPRRCGRHIVRSDFLQKSLLTHSVAAPPRIEPACRASIRVFCCSRGIRRYPPYVLRTAYRSQRLFVKVASHSFCRSSSPNRTRLPGFDSVFVTAAGFAGAPLGALISPFPKSAGRLPCPPACACTHRRVRAPAQTPARSHGALCP